MSAGGPAYTYRGIIFATLFSLPLWAGVLMAVWLVLL